jgi:phosphate starvation-inducible protein PhoH and related proteins
VPLPHVPDPVLFTVPGNHLMAGLLGPGDELLRQVEREFPETSVVVRGNQIAVDGGDAASVAKVFEEVLGTEVFRGAKGRSVRPKTTGQRRYVDAIASNVVTFGVGPAGTGKSWLAVAMAVQAVQAKAVQRIILTRPAVEAGERLGFLPGDLMAKIDPYLRPLYDALFDMVEAEGVARMQERGQLEVAPLAFMRGRTLNHSFIILDEAQNTTPEQMKMFLTRIGFGSRAVITGDMSQVDVGGGRSGLVGLDRILTGVDGLAWIYLDGGDVVRHQIVADIVAAYDRTSVGTANTAGAAGPAGTARGGGHGNPGGSDGDRER